MRLTSIDIRGFKSFAKHTHLSFQEGITAIIGPNGSGKSNIAEAIRWVLGEQSSKAIRAKERTDVIYTGESGSAAQATVTLTFLNDMGRFPVPAPEIAITRSLNRDGESEYSINRQPVRLIDLHHMLATAGIGTKGYTVISQGTVDQFVTASPTIRKELFDEATGVKALQITLREAENKLAKTMHHQQEARALLLELTPRVQLLKRQLDRYEKREQYEKEFRIKQEQWYLAAWHRLQEEVATLSTQHHQYKEHISKAREQRVHAENGPVAVSPSVQEFLRQCQEYLEQILHGTLPTISKTKQLYELLTTIRAPKQVSTKLEQARRAEIRAEREESASQVALDLSKKELATLEQEILRELGTSVLANISSSHSMPVSIPSNEELQDLSHKIAAIGAPDPLTAKEYEEANHRQEGLQKQLEDIEGTIQTLQLCITDVEQQIQQNFQEQFRVIQASFTSYFQQLFDGGNTTLIHDDEGIDIMVTPPKKRPRSIGLLSGGEKALTSLALLLAILDARKPPFIVLDEVDAALDEANSRRFALLLKSYQNHTQRLVISHNRETMAVASLLYGVTMQQGGISQVYSVTLDS